MAIYSITTDENDKIVSERIGPSLITGAIEVTEAQFSQIKTLRQQATEAGRVRDVYWVNSQPALPADTRTVIDVLLNGVAQDAMVQLGNSVNVTLQVGGNYSGDMVIVVFGKRFLFTFTDGEATRAVTPDYSAVFEIKSNENFIVNTPVSIDVVE